jgi:hypothetical protein
MRKQRDAEAARRENGSCASRKQLGAEAARRESGSCASWKLRDRVFPTILFTPLTWRLSVSYETHAAAAERFVPFGGRAMRARRVG